MKKITLFAIALKVSICLAQSGTQAKTDSSTNPFLQRDQQSVVGDISNYIANQNNLSFNNGATLSTFAYKDATQGSRYLFGKWVKGKVTNQRGQLVASDGYLFNYDKMTGNFLLTADNKTIIELNKEQIRSCELIEVTNTYKFEKVEGLGTNVFCIALAGTNKTYVLYKKVTTKFEKSNYATNGITTSGHNYDLYIDKPIYYLYTSGTNQLKQIDLRKKSIKEAMPQDQAKVDAYFSQHSDTAINEDFFIGLINSINQ